MPTLKCFLHITDVAPDQAPTSVQRGSHRIPWAPDGVYDLHTAGYKGYTGAAGFAGRVGTDEYNAENGYAPTRSLPNKVVFAAEAGDMMIFDYSIFHTSMPNTSLKPREALITGYGGGPTGNPRTEPHRADHVDDWLATGLLDESQKRMLGVRELSG